MNKSPSAISVDRQARAIAHRVFTGSRETIRKKENHLVFVAEAIRREWKVNPYKWEPHHLVWLFSVALSSRSAGTKYRYFRYIRRALWGMGLWPEWAISLEGGWMYPIGAKPASLMPDATFSIVDVGFLADDELAQNVFP